MVWMQTPLTRLQQVPVGGQGLGSQATPRAQVFAKALHQIGNCTLHAPVEKLQHAPVWGHWFPVHEPPDVQVCPAPHADWGSTEQFPSVL